MTIQPKGFAEVQRRMDEIRGRLDELKGPQPEPTPVFEQLVGQASLGMSHDPFAGGGFEPFRPMGLVPSGAGELRPLIQQTASQEGVPGHLLEALVAVESNFNPKATSHAGAMGLTQLMPKTAKSLGVADPYDPVQNLQGGARYLGQMLRQFGSTELALAAYNAGPGAVQRHGGIPPFEETQNYVRKVTSLAAQLGGAGGGLSGGIG